MHRLILTLAMAGTIAMAMAMPAHADDIRAVCGDYRGVEKSACVDGYMEAAVAVLETLNNGRANGTLLDTDPETQAALVALGAGNRDMVLNAFNEQTADLLDELQRQGRR